MRLRPSSVFILASLLPGTVLASSLSACTFDTSGPRADTIDAGPGPGDPDASVDAFVSGDDGGGVAHTVKHDTAQDFGEPTPRLESAVVEAWGAVGIAPAPTGALLARGMDGRRFLVADTNPDTANDSWENASRAPHRGSSLMGPSPTGLFDGRPVNLNNMPANDWTMTLEGEVWLEAGDHQWELTVDDDGFLELANPGSSSYTRILTAPVNTPRTTTQPATTTGWHPIRIAVTNGVGPGHISLRHRGPRDTGLTAIPPFRLRPPPGTQSPTGGLLGVGFDNNLMLGSRGSVPRHFDGLSVNELTAHTFGILNKTTNWAGRWTGQVRIDAAGVHRFRVSSDDGQRLYINGGRVIDAYTESASGAALVVREADVNLEVGWHDIAVDLRQGDGPAVLRLEMAAPGQAYSLLSLARTRPTLLRTPQVTGNIVSERKEILHNNDGVVYDLAVDAVGTGAVDTVDLFVNIDHEAHRDLEVSVFPPGATERTVILAVGSLTTSGVARVALPNIQVFQGNAPAGIWKVVVRDLFNNSDNSIDDGDATAAALVIHYKGGEPTMQKRGTYESAVLDLGKVVGFDAVSWVARTPAGSSIAVRARTCATADGCAAESWSAPLTSGQRPPIPTARAFFQYQVELVSNGDTAPSLESLEIAYRK